MNGMRLLALGCTLVFLAACDRIPSEPLGSPAAEGNPPPVSPPGPGVEELQGVVEAADDRLLLRQPDRVIMLVGEDTDALWNVLGREVVLRGTFRESGEFAVASFRLAEDDDEAATARVPAKPQTGRAIPVRK